MLGLEVLQRKPSVFRTLTGVTMEEFGEIYTFGVNYYTLAERDKER